MCKDRGTKRRGHEAEAEARPGGVDSSIMLLLVAPLHRVYNPQPMCQCLHNDLPYAEVT